MAMTAEEVMADMAAMKDMIAVWADWSTRFKDAIGARGHPAARAALDAVENLPSQSAMGDGNGAGHDHGTSASTNPSHEYA